MEIINSLRGAPRSIDAKALRRRRQISGTATEPMIAPTMAYGIQVFKFQFIELMITCFQGSVLRLGTHHAILTVETREITEQAKINISPFEFAMMIPANKSKMEDSSNASN